METKKLNAQAVDKVAFFRKVMDDKRAIHQCIRTGGNLNKLAKKRDIKFATPI